MRSRSRAHRGADQPLGRVRWRTRSRLPAAPCLRGLLDGHVVDGHIIDGTRARGVHCRWRVGKMRDPERSRGPTRRQWSSDPDPGRGDPRYRSAAGSLIRSSGSPAVPAILPSTRSAGCDRSSRRTPTETWSSSNSAAPGPRTSPARRSRGSTDKVALQSAVESCLASLHADLRFYTTAMFADDRRRGPFRSSLREGQPRRHLLWHHG